MSQEVESGTITVELNYKIYNFGTEEEPMYDIDVYPMHEYFESDEWFPSIEEAQSYIKYMVR